MEVGDKIKTPAGHIGTVQQINSGERPAPDLACVKFDDPRLPNAWVAVGDCTPLAPERTIDMRPSIAERIRFPDFSGDPSP